MDKKAVDIMWVDYHSHILPGMDDGADSPRTAVGMIDRLQRQGVEEIVLTPHYYAARESLDSFLSRREAAFRRLTEQPQAATFPPLRRGAEVRLERDASSWEGLRELCTQGTDYLLIELPYARYHPWMLQEIENIAYAHRVKPILAHLDRYLTTGLMTGEEAARLWEFPEGVVQLNAGVCCSLRGRLLLRRVLRAGCPVVFGSDTHNLADRAPQFDRLIRALGKRYEPLTLF